MRKEEPVAVIARGAGISRPISFRWRDEFPQDGFAALYGHSTSAKNNQDYRNQFHSLSL